MIHEDTRNALTALVRETPREIKHFHGIPSHRANEDQIEEATNQTQERDLFPAQGEALKLEKETPTHHSKPKHEPRKQKPYKDPKPIRLPKCLRESLAYLRLGPEIEQTP